MPRIRMPAEARKADLTETALGLAAKPGSHYKRLNAADVARAARCSRSLVWKYFPHPSHLHQAILRAAIKSENLAVVAQGLADGSALCANAPEALVTAALDWQRKR